MENKRRAWIDPGVLYSRQDIAERTGLSDDVLSFWIRRGLLIPEKQEGSGKGIHHRFHYSQVNIAVLLAIFRDHFGANIGKLKSLSDTVQGAVNLFRKTKAPIDAWRPAVSLADSLARFRRGDPPEIMPYDDELGTVSQRRPAASEAEIIGYELELCDASAAIVLKLAETLGPGKITDYQIAAAMLGAPLYPQRFDGDYWLLRQTEDGWNITYDADDGTRDRSRVGPAAFVPIGSILRDAWKLPSSNLIRAMDHAARMRAALKDAGLSNVEVFVDRDAEEPQPQFILNDVPYEDVEKALLPYFGPAKYHRQGVDWRRYHHIHWNPSDDGDAEA